jgi:DNA-directed RNA polymerase subunit RPC12/RpoP
MKALTKLFCPTCSAQRNFRLLDETGRGQCPKCGFSRFVPMGHCAEVAQLDLADQLLDHAEEA